MREFNSILVTGGAGFIGCNFIQYMLDRNSEFDGKIVNFDKLTYAGNLSSLKSIAEKHEGQRYYFEKGDINNITELSKVLKKYNIDAVVHFAAESHVDRSINGPETFIKTNVVGTFRILEACKNFWKNRKDVHFHHVSTDEVYGSLGEEGFFTEHTPYDPRSPYSASKASSNHIVNAFYHTYGLPITISNCSNNYGPFQFPEKLIPLMILNILDNKPLPVYGDGSNIRDWLYVDDHSTALWAILKKGRLGEVYNIGGENEWRNIDLLKQLIKVVSKARKLNEEAIEKNITFVKDRPGHDLRYAIDCSKITKELHWKPSFDFEKGLEKTVGWYLKNEEWCKQIKSGEYLNWMQRNYINR